MKWQTTPRGLLLCIMSEVVLRKNSCTIELGAEQAVFFCFHKAQFFFGKKEKLTNHGYSDLGIDLHFIENKHNEHGASREIINSICCQ